MFRVASLIYSLAGPTLAGALVIICLVAGLDGLRPILAAAGAGFLAGLPAAWLIAERIVSPRK